MPITRPRLGTGFITPRAPDRHHGPDNRDPVVHWQALVDAGLIGGNPPLSPAVLASILAAEAIVRRPAGGVW